MIKKGTYICCCCKTQSKLDKYHILFIVCLQQGALHPVAGATVKALTCSTNLVSIQSRLGGLFNITCPAQPSSEDGRHAKKITTGAPQEMPLGCICLIFRGLFFEHNAACPVVAIAKTENWAKRPFMDGQ